MRALTLLLTLISLPPTAMAQRVSIATGSLTLPSGFVVRAMRGTDSHPGVILRADSSLVIHYDR